MPTGDIEALKAMETQMVQLQVLNNMANSSFGAGLPLLLLTMAAAITLGLFTFMQSAGRGFFIEVAGTFCGVTATFTLLTLFSSSRDIVAATRSSEKALELLKQSAFQLAACRGGWDRAMRNEMQYGRVLRNRAAALKPLHFWIGSFTVFNVGVTKEVSDGIFSWLLFFLSL